MIELHSPTWSSQKHAAQWQSTLETYAFPVMENKAVDEITPSDALAVLEPIWTVKSETATRIRQRMETVMDWAVSRGSRNTILPCHITKRDGRSHRCGNPPLTF